MDEQNEFSALLSDLLHRAALNNDTISREDIKKTFEHMNLPDEKLAPVYDYITGNGILITSSDEASLSETLQGTTQQDKNKVSETALFKMYSGELRSHKKISRSDEISLAKELHLALQRSLPDADRIKERYIEQKLHYILSLAKKHASGGSLLDDLVSEGNLALMLALAEPLSETEDLNAFVETAIENAMNAYVDAEYQNESSQQSMVAKVSFVSAAAKALKEENETDPTYSELAAYTNMTEDELERIVKLSGDTLKSDEYPAIAPKDFKPEPDTF